MLNFGDARALTTPGAEHVSCSVCAKYCSVTWRKCSRNYYCATTTSHRCDDIWAQAPRFAHLFAAIFTFVPCLLPFRNRISLSGVFASTVPLAHNTYAYCTFLSPDSQATGNSLDNEGHCFTGMRMLIYQLFHDPATRDPNDFFNTCDCPRYDRRPSVHQRSPYERRCHRRGNEPTQF